MPHIETISEEVAQGKLKEIYAGLIESRGKIAKVHKIQSLNPQSRQKTPFPNDQI